MPETTAAQMGQDLVPRGRSLDSGGVNAEWAKEKNLSRPFSAIQLLVAHLYLRCSAIRHRHFVELRFLCRGPIFTRTTFETLCSESFAPAAAR